jgi:tetratricopeptide (TPR) repeat protein
MIPQALRIITLLLAWAAAAAPGQPGPLPLTQRHWFEARTAHFNIYSCGSTQEVARVAGRLEQFREAYSLLAGAQAVASPPIVVMAFPDLASMQPFLPLYQDKPANLTAFFNRGSDQNLIVLPLSDSEAGSLKIIFHEYTHLLLRHNQPYWPMWLTEGMAEIYATFEARGGFHVRIGNPIDHHLCLLERRPLLPLKELFAVTRDSPDYNEGVRQGIFYSESWLLTHYLMLGGNPAHKANFRQLTPLLRLGEPPEQAFTNALHTTLPAMEAELRRYLKRGKFEPLELTVSASLETSRAFATRGLTPTEVCYRLGDELLHIGRLDTAESYFLQARKLAPGSPLAYEGLGSLAAKRGQSTEAVRWLHQAAQLGPLNFLAHYTYAREKYLLTASGPRMHPLGKEAAAEIRGELQKSLALMPDFGPAHHLLGFFEMVQGEDLAAARQHLQRAIQLEPENQSYLLSLAQVELAANDLKAARHTLEPLRLPYVEPQVRAHAEEMIKALGQAGESDK